MDEWEPSDGAIRAARAAIERRQRSLVAKITLSSIRDALVAAREEDRARQAARLCSFLHGSGHATPYCDLAWMAVARMGERHG